MKLVNQKSHVDQSKCIGCHTCERRCPMQAIKVSKGSGKERDITPCRAACPAGVDVPGYLGLASEGKFLEAYHLIMKNNPFPSVCGRICTHPCESECNRCDVDKPLAIRNVKKYLADKAYEMGMPETVKALPANGKNVAIIGAGPSGLTCGYYLALLGYKVDVYEQESVAGGVLLYGIPEYRLPKAVLAREVEHIEKAGVNIHLNTSLGKEITLEELKANADAVYLATGTQFPRKMGVPGEELPGVYHGLDFLKDVNLKKNIEIGKKVVVVGGGNTAIDAARTAVRLGAEEVTLVYRRGALDMPADRQEISEAFTEGVKLIAMAKPVEVVGDSKATGLKCIKTEYVVKDAYGRRAIKDVEGSEFVVEADIIIPAVSQFFDLPFIGKEVFQANEKGNFVTDEETLMTSVDGVFAGGDMTRGSDAAIAAIGDGRKAALSIHHYLGGAGDLYTGDEIEIPMEPDNSDMFKNDRFPLEYLSIEERKNTFKEALLGYTEENVINEAKRCLRCDTQSKASVDETLCAACHLCEEFCPKGACSMELREQPLVIGHPIKKKNVEIIEKMCLKARMYPLMMVCTCTGTTAAEICQAILEGAKTPLDVSRMTGVQTGCGGLYCAGNVQKLLQVAGVEFGDRDDEYYYANPLCDYDLDPELDKKYPSFHLKDDINIRFTEKMFEPENRERLWTNWQFDETE